MPLLVGIDEAGYGPLLGPLVVAASLWRVRRDDLRADLWQRLDPVVTRRSKRDGWQLRIDDSKAVYQRGKGLVTLERPVLACAAAAGIELSTLHALVVALTGHGLEQASMPWYRQADESLPLDAATQYDAIARRLKRQAQDAGIACAGPLAEIVPECRYNDRIAHTGNKATIVVEQVLRLIQRAAARATGEMLVVRVDRLGGRTRYDHILRLAFPERHLHVIEAGSQRSRYRLAGQPADWFIEFAADSDQNHLPVALASMTAKYLREAFVARFNRFWRRFEPTLRPTAGYYTDARRFLDDIAPLLPKAGLRTEQFVRSR